MFCPRCGQQNEAGAVYCQSCGNDLSTTKQMVVSSSYAGFWKRFAALLIDSIVVSVASGLISAATVGVGSVSIFVLPWLYEALMLSSEKQATLGKMALGIAVTDLSGGRISFGRATGRHFDGVLEEVFDLVAQRAFVGGVEGLAEARRWNRDRRGGAGRVFAEEHRVAQPAVAQAAVERCAVEREEFVFSVDQIPREIDDVVARHRHIVPAA